jgi:uncharacterized Tic20 family protein
VKLRKSRLILVDRSGVEKLNFLMEFSFIVCACLCVSVCVCVKGSKINELIFKHTYMYFKYLYIRELEISVQSSRK